MNQPVSLYILIHNKYTIDVNVQTQSITYIQTLQVYAVDSPLGTVDMAIIISMYMNKSKYIYSR